MRRGGKRARTSVLCQPGRALPAWALQARRRQCRPAPPGAPTLSSVWGCCCCPPPLPKGPFKRLAMCPNCPAHLSARGMQTSCPQTASCPWGCSLRRTEQVLGRAILPGAPAGQSPPPWVLSQTAPAEAGTGEAPSVYSSPGSSHQE